MCVFALCTVTLSTQLSCLWNLTWVTRYIDFSAWRTPPRRDGISPIRSRPASQLSLRTPPSLLQKSKSNTPSKLHVPSVSPWRHMCSRSERQWPRSSRRTLQITGVGVVSSAVAMRTSDNRTLLALSPPSRSAAPAHQMKSTIHWCRINGKD